MHHNSQIGMRRGGAVMLSRTDCFLSRKIHLLDRRCSTEELRALVNQSVEKIQDRMPEGGVCLLLDDHPVRFAIAFFALLDHGIRPVLLDPNGTETAAAALAESLPGVSIWNNGFMKIGNGESLVPRNAAFACRTSGSTGRPGLCWYSEEGARANARAHAGSMGIGPSDIVMQTLPLHHAFGVITGLWTPLVAGAAVQFGPALISPRSLCPPENHGGVLHLSPLQMRLLLKTIQKPVNGFRVVSVGLGRADLGELKALEAAFPGAQIFVTYGLSEAGPRVTTGNIGHCTHPGYVGQRLDGIQLSVLLDDGNRKPCGTGRLCVQSPSLKLNLRADETTSDRAALLTRDRVTILAGGEVVFISRDDDLIKSGGTTVYPLDIEAAVRSTGLVQDCAVLACSDERLEQIPVLFIAGDVEPNPLRQALAKQLNPEQMPRRIITIPEIPRNSSGKIDRSQLLRRWEKS